MTVIYFLEIKVQQSYPFESCAFISSEAPDSLRIYTFRALKKLSQVYVVAFGNLSHLSIHRHYIMQ